MAIITTAQYKTYRGITASTYDTLLGVLIPAVQKRAERYCNREFDSTVYSGATAEVLSGSGTATICLRNTPITAISSISISVPGGGSYSLSSTQWTYDAESGIVGLISGIYTTMGLWSVFPKGIENVTVGYTAGYTSQTMPADLQLAMYESVDEVFSKAGGGSKFDPSILSETLGDYSYTRRGADDANETWRTRWRPFRRNSIGIGSYRSRGLEGIY